jgi:predicted RNase H-like HicB family nuclease
MNEILCVVEEADEGSYGVSAVGMFIHTEAETVEELHQEIRDAVHGHFEAGETPPLMRLHHVHRTTSTALVHKERRVLG